VRSLAPLQQEKYFLRYSFPNAGSPARDGDRVETVYPLERHHRRARERNKKVDGTWSAGILAGFFGRCMQRPYS